MSADMIYFLPNFIHPQLQKKVLRMDIQIVRQNYNEKKYFQLANIEQDHTMRMTKTEICFIDTDKFRFNWMERNDARQTFYNIVDEIGIATLHPFRRRKHHRCPQQQQHHHHSNHG